MTLHNEILTPIQADIARKLGAVATQFNCYLAGGTALALYLGHRRSEDFDWFASAPGVAIAAIVSAVEAADLHVDVTDMSPGTLLGRIQGVKVSFFEYPYPLLDPAVEWPEGHARIASLRDLAAMKLLAIAQRGSRKDFVDIYELLRSGANLKDMLVDFRAKFGVEETISVLRGLVYFDDAEAEPLPKMLIPLRWDELKSAMQARVREGSR